MTDLVHRRAISPVGKKVIRLNIGGLNTEAYSVTAFTQLDESCPVIISSGRKDSNNQLDFIAFLLQLIEGGHLVTGDTLVIDNVSVHTGLETIDILYDLLKSANVKLVFLPTYSPELNLIELVFMWVKRNIRENRSSPPL